MTVRNAIRTKLPASRAIRWSPPARRSRVVLRQVDERDIGLTQTSVEVLEGKHTLLVDCRIAETKAVSRHSAGGRGVRRS